MEVYGKDADFSAAADPIVRVDARRLRDKLREYYASAPHDPVVISVGISTCPHSDVNRKDDLFGHARRAFLDAQKKGGGVVCGT